MSSTAFVAFLMFLVAFGYTNVGLGGGLLYFPLLNYFYPDWEPSTLVALTLLFSITTLAASARNHYSKGFVHVRHALILAIPMVVGAICGARLTMSSSIAAIRIFFSCVLLVIALKMITDMLRNRRIAEKPPKGMTRLHYILVGFVAAGAGFLSGSVGIGGGIISIPLLIYAMNFETRDAVGTASLALLMTASSGLTTYLFSHGVHTSSYLAGLFVLSTFTGSSLGSQFGLRKLKSREVRLLFISLLMLTAVWTGTSAILR